MYIIYMDVFFLLNFWIDLFLIFMLRYIIKQHRTFFCICSAVISALLTTGLLFLYLKGLELWLLLVGGIGILLLMKLIAFGKNRLLWHCLLFAIEGAVYSAVLSFFVLLFSNVNGTNRKSTDIVAVCFVIVVTAVLCVVLERQSRIQWKEEHCKAKTVLEFGSRKMLATALIDTGNKLYDPFYHRPVILVDASMLEEIMQECREQRPEKLQYIPFRSIGKEKGMLEGLMLDRVSLKWQEKTWRFTEVIAASAKEALCQNKEYQVIFHCGLFEEG